MQHNLTFPLPKHMSMLLDKNVLSKLIIVADRENFDIAIVDIFTKIMIALCKFRVRAVVQVLKHLHHP